MKYVKEIDNLFTAFPDRSFQVIEIVRYATGDAKQSPRQREASRKAVKRALDTLVDIGLIEVSDQAKKNGLPNLYRIKRTGT